MNLFTYNYDFNPDFVAPVGQALSDLMRDSGTSIETVSQKTGLTLSEIQGFINGDINYNHKIGIKLSNCFHGIPVRTWEKIDKNYKHKMGSTSHFHH